MLWLQGAAPHPQPHLDAEGNLLMWNGDVFNREELGEVQGEEEESDTVLVARRLGAARCVEEVLEVVGRVRGPWALVYLHRPTDSLWFGRDYFGRSSLLAARRPGGLALASVAPASLPGYAEVPAGGIYRVHLATLQLHLHPWQGRLVEEEHLTLGRQVEGEHCSLEEQHCTLGSPVAAPLVVERLSEVWEPLEDLPTTDVFTQLLRRPRVAAAVAGLVEVLRRAVERRVVRHQPRRCKDCLLRPSCGHAAVAVLLSGGVDSSLLALLVLQLLPPSAPVDLPNVAFEQAGGGFEVPDRVTGRAAVSELAALTGRPELELLCVDVTKEELVEAREERVRHLLHPLNTVLDDSIGCAVWFAAMGVGRAEGGGARRSRARVLVLGMGIDEQLGGYSRHRAAFQQGGRPALAAELRRDLARIAARNLGRDDRVVSDHGLAGRMPFLDEELVTYLLQLELSLKCDFRLGRGQGEKLVLRLAAHSLGLRGAAREPKRAVQFGSRIAKMENRKEKAHQQAVR